MFLRNVLLAAMVLVPAALSGREAAAVPYSFTSAGSFSDCSNCTVASNGTMIGWGGTGSITSPFYSGSTLTATSLTGQQTGATPASQDLIGQITWYNASTSMDSTAASVSAAYKLALHFTQPSPGGTGSDSFALSITNTANTARVCFVFFCTNTGDVNDTATVTPAAASFTVDGLTISNIKFVESGSGSFAGGIWSNPEDGSSTLKIYADIAVTPAPAAVPEPMTLALLGTGLLGMGAVRRVRRAA